MHACLHFPKRRPKPSSLHQLNAVRGLSFGRSRPRSPGTCCRAGPSFTLAPGDSNKLNTVLQHLKSPFFFPKMKIGYPFQNEQGQCSHLDHHKPFGETPSVPLCRARHTNVWFCLSLYLLPGLFTGGSEMLNRRKGSTE